MPPPAVCDTQMYVRAFSTHYGPSGMEAANGGERGGVTREGADKHHEGADLAPSLLNHPGRHAIIVSH